MHIGSREDDTQGHAGMEPAGVVVAEGPPCRRGIGPTDRLPLLRTLVALPHTDPDGDEDRLQGTDGVPVREERYALVGPDPEDLAAGGVERAAHGNETVPF